MLGQIGVKWWKRFLNVQWGTGKVVPLEHWRRNPLQSSSRPEKGAGFTIGLEIYTGEEAIGAEVGIAAAPCPAISSRGFPAGLVPGSGCPESISVLRSNLLSGYILDHKIRSIQNNFYWSFRWTAGKFRCTNRYCENNTEEWPSSLFQRTVDWNVVWVHDLRNAGHGTPRGVWSLRTRETGE